MTDPEARINQRWREHLPECIGPAHELYCICDALRACEARVRDEYKYPFDLGYLTALHQAREAVLSVWNEWTEGDACDPSDECSECAMAQMCLNSIDALREEMK